MKLVFLKKNFENFRKKSLFSNAFIYLIANIINAAIPFALLPVLTRYVNPAEYGELAMFQTLLGMLSAFVGVNVTGAVGRKYYDELSQDFEFRDFVSSCFQLIVVTGILIFLVLAFFADASSRMLGIEPSWIFLAAFLSVSAMITQLLLVLLQVRGKSVRYGALLILQSALNLGVSLFLIVIANLGVVGRIYAQVFASSVFAFSALYILYKSKLLKFWTWRPDYLIEALRYGIPLSPHVGGIFLLSTVDRVVIKSELGLADAGVYVVAVQLVGTVSLILDAFNNAYVPWLFERLKRNSQHEKNGIVVFTYSWYVILLLGCVLSFFVGPSVVRVVAGKQYHEAGNLIGVLVLAQVFGGMYLMVTNYIFYSRKTIYLSFVTLLSGCLNLVLLVLLTRLYGLLGTTYAVAISMATRFLLTWFVAQRVYPMPWFSFKIT